MEYVLLKDVTQESHRWRVRVRAARFSEYADDSIPRKVLRLDFDLLDEQWINTLFCSRKNKPSQSRYTFGLSSNNVGLLILLDKCPRMQKTLMRTK